MTSTETIFKELFAGVMEMSDPAVWTMFAIGGILIWLGVKKDYEPVLLFPMGVGCILANIPGHFAGRRISRMWLFRLRLPIPLSW